MEKIQKIPLFQVRTFGDKFTATFDFIAQNWRVVLRYVLYLLLPLCLLLPLGLNTFVSGAAGTAFQEGDIDNSKIASWMVSYAVTVVCYLVCGILVTALSIGLMNLYQKRDNGLQGLTWTELRPVLLHGCKRTVILGLAMMVVFFLVIMLVATVASIFDTTALLLLLVVACFLGLPLMLATPVYLFEDDTTLFESFRRAYILGWPTYWSMLGFLLVVGLVCQFISGITTMPWYFMTIVKTALSIRGEDTGVTTSVYYTFGQYLLGVLQAAGAFLCAVIGYVALMFQYGHARETVEGTSVEGDIERFDDIGNNDALDEFDDTFTDKR